MAGDANTIEQPARRKRRVVAPKLPKLTAANIQAAGILLAGIGVVMTGIGLFFTAHELNRSTVEESARFGLQFDDRFNTPRAIAVMDAALSDPPEMILAEHKGRSAPADLEYVIGNYDTLYYLHEDGVISDQMIYDLFCGDLEVVYSNKEVQAYIKEVRTDAGRQGPDIFVGFDKMNATCHRWDDTGIGHRLAR